MSYGDFCTSISRERNANKAIGAIGRKYLPCTPCMTPSVLNVQPTAIDRDTPRNVRKQAAVIATLTPNEIDWLSN